MPPQPVPSDQRPKKSLRTWFDGLSRTGKFRVFLFAAVILVAPFAIYMGMDEPNQAKTGDCMAGQNESDMRVVECTDAAAQWTVLGRLDGKTEADYANDACSVHPGTEASFYQDGRRFRKGFILCLGPADK